MYLVSIARLRVDEQPVPLSQLAQTLSVSPVSVNEMCRKLQDQGLVIYRPYKGASLTPEGEQQAYYVLRRHRLWEVFLVDKLGFAYEQAHDTACRLEHDTPELLADRLDAFLEFPSVNPEGEFIPKPDGTPRIQHLTALAALPAGQRAHVVRCEGNDTTRAFLEKQGVRPGTSLTVLATGEASLLLQVEESHVSLARALAEAIKVEPRKMDVKTTRGTPSQSLSEQEEERMKSKTETTISQVTLDQLSVGQRGIVVRVRGKGAIKRRMMDMGLVPGSEVKVLRMAPLGDPVEFEVKGYSLSLRKKEASDITVELAQGGQ
jgi:DtxR family Mn-dependent transcriptional regulator